MAAEHLLATLEQTLRQTRTSRARLASRLADLEHEAAALRAEIEEMDTVAAQTEETIYRVMSTVLGGRSNATRSVPAPYQPLAGTEPAHSPVAAPSPSTRPYNEPVREAVPTAASYTAPPPAPPVAAATPVSVLDGRFAERTIPQAVVALLRDEGGPLHVNDIYQRLLEGGFVFSGHNPTISVATSLSRNSRFRRVAPSTFDLVMREAASQAS